MRNEYTTQVKALAMIVDHSTAEDLFEMRNSIAITLNECATKVEELAILVNATEKQLQVLATGGTWLDEEENYKRRYNRINHMGSLVRRFCPAIRPSSNKQK